MSNYYNWRRVSDALHYALSCLEEDPTSPKLWRRAFDAMERYDKLRKDEESANDCT